MTTRQQRTPLGAMYRTPLGAFGKGVELLPCHEVWHNADNPGFGTSFGFVEAENFLNWVVGTGSGNDCDSFQDFVGAGLNNSVQVSTNVQRIDKGPVTFADLRQFVLRGRTSGEILDVPALLLAATDKFCTVAPEVQHYYGGGFVDGGAGTTTNRAYEYSLRFTLQQDFGDISFFVNDGLGFSNSLYPNLTPNESYDVLQCPSPATYTGTVLQTDAFNAELSASPCGIGLSPGTEDWFVRIDIDRVDGNPILIFEYLNEMVGLTMTGNQSGTVARIGGTGIYCNDNNSNVVHVPGYTADWQWFHRVSGFTFEDLVYKLSGPQGWIVGETVTIA